MTYMIYHSMEIHFPLKYPTGDPEISAVSVWLNFTPIRPDENVEDEKKTSLIPPERICMNNVGGH